MPWHTSSYESPSLATYYEAALYTARSKIYAGRRPQLDHCDACNKAGTIQRVAFY